MSQVLVRNLDASVVESLKRRAKQHGRSLQAELKAILEAGAQENLYDPVGEIEQVRALFAGRRFSDSAGLIREDRGR